MTDNTKALAPCPFCGSTDIDPMGWSDGNGNDGPQCNECGATAESITGWNRRAAQQAAAPGFSSGVSAEAPGLAGQSSTVGERDRFEAWIVETLNYGYDLVRDEPGTSYRHDATDTAWLAWQARAALAPAAQAEPVATATVLETLEGESTYARLDRKLDPGVRLYTHFAQPAGAEPVAFVHWPLNGPPRLVWYSNKAMHEAIEKGNKAQNGYVPDLLLYAPSNPPAQHKEQKT